jgi:hypothetical protein
MLIVIFRSLIAGFQTRQSLVIENLALRHQVQVLKRGGKRPKIKKQDRALWVLLIEPDPEAARTIAEEPVGVVVADELWIPRRVTSGAVLVAIIDHNAPTLILRLGPRVVHHVSLPARLFDLPDVVVDFPHFRGHNRSRSSPCS